MIFVNIGAEWITRTDYVFSDASARVHGQGHDRYDIVIAIWCGVGHEMVGCAHCS